MPVEGKFPGLYRGEVIENDDRPVAEGGKSQAPIGDDQGPIGRVRVKVPQVYGDALPDEDLPWAEVCYPFGGGPESENKLLSGIFWVPRKGTYVWVMFEHGDPQRPIVVGAYFGKKTDTEVPAEAIDRSRPPYDTEEERSQVKYPDIFVFKPPGKSEDAEKLAMCIRFVSDKRIDIVLDENNWIEIDDGGSPAEDDFRLTEKMIRVHSSDRRIAVTSDFDDANEAIMLLARAGGIKLEAEQNISLHSKSGGVYIGAATETAIVPDVGNVITQGTQQLDLFSGTIIHQGSPIIASGPVGGCYYHPPLGGHC
jgi:hypothetical protein